MRSVLFGLTAFGILAASGCSKPEAPPKKDSPTPTPTPSASVPEKAASMTTMHSKAEPPADLLEGVRTVPTMEHEDRVLPELTAEFQKATTTEDKLSALVDLDSLDSPEAAEQIATLTVEETDPEVKAELLLSYVGFDIPIEIRRAFLVSILETPQHAEVQDAVKEAVSRLEGEAAEHSR